MAKGAKAKEYITKKLQETFGADFLGEMDKKIYIQAPEDGTKIQIAISMTCPKNTIEVSNAPIIKNGMLDFEAEGTIVTPTATTEITAEERETVTEMMRRLGL